MRDLLLEVLPSTLTGGLRDRLLYVLAFCVLALGTLLCLLALRVRVLDVAAVALASGGAAAWLLSNTAGEGDTLLVVLPGNGLVSADLAVLPAAVLVAVLCWRRVRRG